MTIFYIEMKIRAGGGSFRAGGGSFRAAGCSPLLFLFMGNTSPISSVSALFAGEKIHHNLEIPTRDPLKYINGQSHPYCFICMGKKGLKRYLCKRVIQK